MVPNNGRFKSLSVLQLLTLLPSLSMITCKSPSLNSQTLTIRITSRTTGPFLRHIQFYHSRFKDCLAFSSKRRNYLTKRNSNHAHKKLKVVADFDGDFNEERGGRGGGEEREVYCEVEVISWRERRIKGEISVNAGIKSVWSALTDYKRLADFVPNLVSSSTIPCPHPGRIWLEQRGLQRALYWHIEARVVLDLQEIRTSANHHELHFSMVDGDFKKYEGKWSLKSATRSTTTRLTYEVNVIPRYNFPAIFLERVIKSDLPVNLRAMACQAERNFEGNQKIPTDILTLLGGGSGGAFHEKDKLLSGDSKETYSSSNFGRMPQSPNELKSNWGIFGKFCQLGRPCLVDEVHLRRFDGLLENGGVHRFVVASITVKAPVPAVWNVLTAYDSLPEIVPNLAISTILSRENNKVRILQEGCKGLLYMVLHARVVLDLCEHLEREISFEQVEGDFDSFKGKWLLEQLGSHHTLLKYTVESKMRRGTVLSEAIMEEVIYKDLPSNLCAIRDYVEEREAVNSLETFDDRECSETLNLYGSDGGVDSDETEEDVSGITDPVSSRQRPRVPGLQRDIEVLKSELLKFISEHGQEGFMPMRKQLRRHGRVDIEKSITHMGGFRKIASWMNLSLAYKHRKPKGYWDNLENLQEEISRFQRSWGMDPSYMPSRKSFERAGRYDIARALEKWGGLREVSRLLSLKTRHPKMQTKDKKVEHAVSASVENEVNIRPKPCVSEESLKWLTKMNDLDINWVE